MDIKRGCLLSSLFALSFSGNLLSNVDQLAANHLITYSKDVEHIRAIEFWHFIFHYLAFAGIDHSVVNNL